jgi:hypothetical protein
VTRLDLTLRQEAVDLRANMDALRAAQYAKEAKEAEEARKEAAAVLKRTKKEAMRRKAMADRLRQEQEEARMDVWVVEQRRCVCTLCCST